MEAYNLEGPPLLKEAPVPEVLSVTAFAKAMEEPNAVVVDTRPQDAYAASHIPGSYSIWLNGLSFFPGWVLKYVQRILLVLDRSADFEIARTYLWRLGFDNIVGYLCPGIGSWRESGKPTTNIGVLTVSELRKKFAKKSVLLIDVRKAHEIEDGYVDGAERIYVGHLETEINRLPKNKHIATICDSGHRAGIAASILKRNGFKKVYNVLGAMKAWKALKYPLKKP
jgi:hydroxyacylglutathione hydrolase